MTTEHTIHPKLLWAEVNTDAIAHNIRQLKARLAPDVNLMAVVKADGYGHGAVPCARTALANGASFLGVARIEEAITLRRAGIAAPILIFGYTPPDMTEILLTHQLHQTVYNLETARAYSTLADQQRKKLAVHVKIDTGMGRLGFPVSAQSPNNAELGQSIRAISALRGIHLTGLSTHFAAADRPHEPMAREQLLKFKQITEELAVNRLNINHVHAANSAALITLPEAHFNMVRPGIAIYGLSPFDTVPSYGIKLRPAMTLKSRIVQLKTVSSGTPVSYGATWRAKKMTRIATIPIGYADGYRRNLSSVGKMLVKGQEAPVAGRVCMDFTMLDVGHIPNVQTGDEVVVFGKQHDAVLPVNSLARQLGTINYEITAALTARIPKVYVQDNPLWE